MIRAAQIGETTESPVIEIVPDVDPVPREPAPAPAPVEQPELEPEPVETS